MPSHDSAGIERGGSRCGTNSKDPQRIGSFGSDDVGDSSTNATDVTGIADDLPCADRVPTDGANCRGCSSAMPSDRGLGLMESCKLTRDIGSQTNGRVIYPGSGPSMRDEGFIEPPSKKAKSDAAPSAVAASEASAPQAAPAAQASTTSSLSKGKDVPTATMTPPSLDGAIKKAAMARQEVDSLKEELGKLKERLKEEEARAAEKDELLRQSSLALLEAANIPAAALDKVPNNSPANGVSMALASNSSRGSFLKGGKVPWRGCI
ncbi:hypothetical protein QYE76_051167 [Lolium multiflorum]|uniref:Uncharacterized protein n=1 Tax=Lolium multiflorum TaxID=4521 RepID=A0AAD8WJW3_LOLMU|nr:hypothetical protein QYE76_051167 [Lolium multiflorum]